MGSNLVLIIVIAAAVCFDFTNGFHDTANAMATSIATGALKPIVAVLLSAVLNFVGAFISISVATTIAKGILPNSATAGVDGLTVVEAALIGAITWNLITWYFTIPSSSSHALIGGLIGAAIASVGSSAVSVHGIVQKVVAPGILAVFVCGIAAFVATSAAYRLIRRLGQEEARRGYRYGQIGSASLVSLAHGTNDAQKTMGVIALALIATGHIDAAHFYVPTWVKLICATSMALGTASGGWRIINTMGNRITTVESPQGFSAEASSAATILASSYYGYPLSTTQTVSGGVMGAGLGKRGGVVHWPVVGQMVTAWVITLPSAAPRPVHSLNRVGELVDSYRYRLSGAADLYLSTVANRQGEVNKQLTTIATIFLPLTFLTGFFGQNFTFLTNHLLETTWSFIVFGLGLLVLSITGFVIYFRRKRWM